MKIDLLLQHKVVDRNGARQSTICKEEPCELVQAICKMERALQGEYNPLDARNHLAEEMADTYIIIEQLKVLYKIDTKSIQDWLDRKQERQRKRLEENE